MMKIQRVLVTGAAGRLGGYVCDDLKSRGYAVAGFDRVPPPSESETFKDCLFVLGDLTSLGDCMRAVSLAEADAIIHLGALPFDTELQPGLPRIQRLPEDECMRVNTMGTYYIMDAARRFNVKVVGMASSYYALGLGKRISGKPFQVDYLPIDEDHPLRPEDTYALSKMLGEEILQAFSRAYGIRTFALRLQGVHYPFRDHSKEYGMRPEPTPNHVGGPVRTTYQYVDARDVAQACALGIEASNLEIFEAFYLSTDSLLHEDTKDIVAKYWPDLIPLAEHLEGNEGIITSRKAAEKLGYKPQYSWRTTTQI